MPSKTSNKILIFLMLGLLVASAFFMRLENFKNSPSRSIDEIVYYRMAQQILDEGPSGYNTIPYGKEMSDAGRPLPDYFFQPLFKHPPVFTFLAALSMKIFGSKLVAAEYVSLLFSVLMIPLIYLLGALVYDRRTGILAAFLLWMDPVSIICSQKAWMDSTLAFLTVLTITFFAYAVYKERRSFFIFSGISCGLAVLTKYTGILGLIAILCYAWWYRPNLFKNKTFLWSLLLPFAFLLPWVLWNYGVYGSGFFSMQRTLHHDAARVVSEFMALRAIFAIGLVGLVAIGWKIYQCRWKPPVSSANENRPWPFAGVLPYFILALLCLAVYPQIKNSLDVGFLPEVSWRTGAFANAHPTFYFGRLIEFSFFYFFSFLSLLGLSWSGKTEKKSILTVSAVIILSFFILWRNYQSRYILSCLPLLLLLASGFLVEAYDRINKIASFIPYLLCKAAFVLLVIFIAARMTYINVAVSFPNDFCFF